MKLTLFTLSCLVLALIAIGCTETAPPTNTANPRTAASPAAPAATPAAATDEFAHAREIYAKNCEACHGPNAEGGLAKVDNKQIKVPSLKAAHAMKHDDAKLTKMITNGEEEMPSFKNKLKPEEISLMVSYIRKVLQGKG